VWPFAILLPVLAAVLTFANHPSDLSDGGTPKWAALAVSVSFTNWFTGPLAEEFGWRGYLLPWFCRRWHPVLAGLVIGPIWAAWHIPIFYDTVFAHWQSALGFLTWVTAWSVVLALLVARARGSVLPSILGHWAINAQSGIFFALLPALSGDKQPGGLAFSVASVAVAAAVAWFWRGTRWNPAV
jgi:membrane protease YdiL (CAAX protease family)